MDIPPELEGKAKRSGMKTTSGYKALFWTNPDSSTPHPQAAVWPLIRILPAQNYSTQALYSGWDNEPLE